jgi:cytoskeletal protein CcmA (bactofilin family)
MWNNKQSTYPPATQAGTAVDTLPEPVIKNVNDAGVATGKSTWDATRVQPPASRVTAWLGPGLTIKGEISGSEDLHLECKVEGPISLGDHRVTVGQSARVSGEITASEIVVNGEVNGNLLASGRIEIKKNGTVKGDLMTARIVVEDGAFFKGAIEVARKEQSGPDLDSLLARPEKNMI